MALLDWFDGMPASSRHGQGHGQGDHRANTAKVLPLKLASERRTAIQSDTPFAYQFAGFIKAR